MSNSLAKTSTVSIVEASASAIETALVGDLNKLSASERVSFIGEVCRSLRLNPLTNPFEYVVLNGKLRLYAKKDCTDQLRCRDQISIRIVRQELIGDIYIVTAEATTPGGRTDSSTGAVSIAGLKGDLLANALMKAETKAKRRVTLSICGLGILDESELETVPGAERVPDQRTILLEEFGRLARAAFPDKPAVAAWCRDNGINTREIADLQRAIGLLSAPSDAPAESAADRSALIRRFWATANERFLHNGAYAGNDAVYDWMEDLGAPRDDKKGRASLSLLTDEQILMFIEEMANR